MLRLLFIALFGTLLLAACEKSERKDVAIEKDTPDFPSLTDVDALTAAEPKDPAAFRTRAYRLTPNQADVLIRTVQHPLRRHQIDPAPTSADLIASQRASAADPFAVPPAIAPEEKRDLETYFAASDVAFPEGTSATYDAASHELTITHNLAGFERIDVVIDQLRKQSEKNIALRVELYELPAPLILELGRSSAPHIDHTPEWKAVQQLVRNGDARSIASLGTMLRSGQRGKASSGKHITAATDYRWDEELEKFLPIEEQQFVGTEIEFDPLIGADAAIIDLNFAFEHHTSAPGERLIELQPPTNDAASKVAVAVFHFHRITTQITTTSGYQNLIGVWRPTVSTSDNALADYAQIAFLKATVHYAMPIERIR